MMRCADGNFYVVKFRNNPQHLRVLANEMLATRLAERAGLPVPVTEVVEVDEWLVEHTPELSIQLAHNTIRCQAGLQFGSRFVVSPLEGQVFDYLPVEMLGLVRNLEDFVGMLVLDKWTGNANGRQAAFWKKLRERKEFTANWNGQPLGELFDKIQTSMPADKPGTLSRSVNAEILAYILQVNKLPAGRKELPVEPDTLKQIQFDAAKN